MTGVVAYKAFNADWTCRDFQYEVGKTYEHAGKVELCEVGFHACTLPFDCWGYYNTLTFARVTLEGTKSKAGEDSKIVGTKITIDVSLSLPEWIKAQAAAVIDLCRAATGALASKKNENAAATGDSGHAAATGYSGHAAATGYSGHAAATGDRGHAEVKGQYGIAASLGYCGTASAEKGCWLVLAFWDEELKLKHVKSVRVGTEGIKPNMKYRLNARGKFVKAA